MTEKRGIAVIGAGPAGLAAAWRLASAGAVGAAESADSAESSGSPGAWGSGGAAAGSRVTVYEAGSVGGRLRTERVGESAADVAVQLLSDEYTSVVDLAQAVGAGQLLVRVPGRDAMWRGGRAHGLRYGSVTSMASSGALPTRLKVRLGMKYLPFLERHAEVLDLNDPARLVAAGLEGESIAEWGGRELGGDFVEWMAYPLLAAYYGVTPEETSAGVFHALARAGLRVRLLGIRGGAGALARAVADWLEARGVEIREGERVESLEVSGSSVRLGVAGGVVEHDGVVVAVPVAEASRLLPGASWLKEVRSRSTATLVLALDRPLDTGWFGLSIPRIESLGHGVAAICVQEAKGVGLMAGRGALVVVPGPAEGQRWAESEPAVALKAALPVLDRVIPGLREGVVEARLVRLGESTFLPEPGHFGRVAAAGGAAGAGLAGVALAGDYLVAPTVEGAVRSGIRAADWIMGVAG
jgi:protoporphyrinogen/coproporphyrinogen III oxidase